MNKGATASENEIRKKCKMLNEKSSIKFPPFLRVGKGPGIGADGWHVPDPAGQFASPYVGMGNNPVIGVDPDGRWALGGRFREMRLMQEAQEKVALWRKQPMESFDAAEAQREFEIMEMMDYAERHGIGMGEGDSDFNSEGTGGDDPPGNFDNLYLEAKDYVTSVLGVEDLIYYGTSIDVTVTLLFGLNVEYGRVKDPFTGVSNDFYSYGWAFGYEASGGFNFLFLLPRDSFNSSDFKGTSQGISGSYIISLSISGNSTWGFSGDSLFDSYYLIKVGYGPGLGINYTPRNTTKFWYGFGN